MIKNAIKKTINKLIVSKLDEVPFIVFISFLCTFLVARTYIYLTATDILNSPLFLEEIYIRGVHIHHLNFGIFILVIVGFFSLYDIRPELHRRLAVVYGIGLGLTFDEFALWLKLQEDYYARITYDAVNIISLILLNTIYFPSFWKKMGSRVLRTVRLIFKNVWK